MTAFIDQAKWTYSPSKWWWLNYRGGVAKFGLSAITIVSMDEMEYYEDYCGAIMAGTPRLDEALDWAERHCKDGIKIEVIKSVGNVRLFFKEKRFGLMFKLLYC